MNNFAIPFVKHDFLQQYMHADTLKREERTFLRRNVNVSWTFKWMVLFLCFCLIFCPFISLPCSLQPPAVVLMARSAGCEAAATTGHIRQHRPQHLCQPSGLQSQFLLTIAKGKQVKNLPEIWRNLLLQLFRENSTRLLQPDIKNYM